MDEEKAEEEGRGMKKEAKKKTEQKTKKNEERVNLKKKGGEEDEEVRRKRQQHSPPCLYKPEEASRTTQAHEWHWAAASPDRNSSNTGTSTPISITNSLHTETRFHYGRQ